MGTAISLLVLPTIIVAATNTTELPTITNPDLCYEALTFDCPSVGCMLNPVNFEGCVPPENKMLCDCRALPSSAVIHDKGNGFGYGNCECKEGLTEMRLRYLGDQGAKEINIYVGGTNGDLVCAYDNVDSGESIMCKVLDAVDPATGQNYGHTKFDDTTEMEIIHDDDTVCYPEFKTKCDGGFDNVGFDSLVCNELSGTGWTDGKHDDDGLAYPQCWNGRVPCVCGTEITTTGAAQIEPGDCLCSVLSSSSTPDADGNGNGYGECGCDKTYGLREMRLQYVGTQPAKRWDVLVAGDPVCRYYNVAPNDTIDCDVQSYLITNTSSPKYMKFDKNTYFFIVHEDNTTCEPVFHTSCSSDIVGYYSTDCEEIFCTAWRDGNPSDDNECNDGTVWCDCCKADETCQKNTTACCFVGGSCDTRIPGGCDDDTTTTIAALTTTGAAATTGSGTGGTTGSGTGGTTGSGSGTTGSAATTGSGSGGTTGAGSGTTGAANTGSGTTGSGSGTTDSGTGTTDSGTGTTDSGTGTTASGTGSGTTDSGTGSGTTGSGGGGTTAAATTSAGTTTSAQGNGNGGESGDGQGSGANAKPLGITVGAISIAFAHIIWSLN